MESKFTESVVAAPHTQQAGTQTCVTGDGGWTGLGPENDSAHAAANHAGTSAEQATHIIPAGAAGTPSLASENALLPTCVDRHDLTAAGVPASVSQGCHTTTTHSSGVGRGAPYRKKPDDTTLRKVYDQPCTAYLATLGIRIADGQRINAPYRPSADSQSWSCQGCFWYDPSHQTSGNVWELALLMHGGNKDKARRSLFDAAGVPMTERRTTDFARHADDNMVAVSALRKVRDAFPIDAAKTPAAVMDYLTKRRALDPHALACLSYVPQGKLATVLAADEIRASGLAHSEDHLICWYMHSGKPVYYCTRAIATKEFRKAPVQYMQHIIFNKDDLYTKHDVIWAEGMFDCLSLMAMGYGVAGEITCGVSAAHMEELVKALRWRAKNHPDWAFTICLDNDEEKNGRRAGNEAAEKLARVLWSHGLDVRWVQHNPTDEKVDINKLHADGKETEIRSMLARARLLSEIFAADLPMCYGQFQLCLLEGDCTGAYRFLKIIREKETGQVKMAEIYDRLLRVSSPWRDVYSDAIEDMFLHGADVHVFFPAGSTGEGLSDHVVFKREQVCDNLRQYQRNPSYDLRWGQFSVPGKMPHWRVAKTPDPKGGRTFNLFRPSPMLMQEPDPSVIRPPELWGRLLDNLASPACKEWLLNHMAHYVQTLQKPRTIPVLYSREGSGKNTLMSLFGQGVGDYGSVGNTSVESTFNSYMQHAVLYLDEIMTDANDVRKLRNKLKGFINEWQAVNNKYEKEYMARLNNYIAIGSNPVPGSLPVVVDKNDRRYTIIAGGADMDVGKEPWFDIGRLEAQLPDFMLYLLSRPVDAVKANGAMDSDTKDMLREAAEDQVTAGLRQWMEDHKAPPTEHVSLKDVCRAVNEAGFCRYQESAQRLRHRLECLGYKADLIHNQYCYSGLSLTYAEQRKRQDLATVTSPDVTPTATTTSATKEADAKTKARWRDVQPLLVDFRRLK
jgi:hypothetical protein